MLERWFGCMHTDYLAHLEAEIAWLKLQMLHERQRAEVAIDRLLVRHDTGPVTLAASEDRATAQTRELEELLRQGDFVHAGDEVDGNGG